MKKKLILRCLLGAPLGLAMSTCITVLISISIGDGGFYPVHPELSAECGNELNAMILQSVCSLIYGASWAGASCIWETERWSILRQSVTHLLICSVFTFPAAYFMHWMEHSVFGILSYFAVFFAVYLLIWMIQYFSMKFRLKRINQKMQSQPPFTD